VHWIAKCIRFSKHAALKPYQLVFSGVEDDMRRLGYKSRMSFLPFVCLVEESLGPGGSPLTEEELTAEMSKVDTSKLVLASGFRKFGFRTLTGLHKAGFSLDDCPVKDGVIDFTKLEKATEKDDDSDLHVVDPAEMSDATSIKSKGKGPAADANRTPVDMKHGPTKPQYFRIFDRFFPAKGKRGKNDLKYELPTWTDLEEPSDPEAPPKSVYQKAKGWLKSSRTTLRKALKRSLRRSKTRLVRYYSLTQGSLFHRLAAIPYGWWISLF